MIYIVFQMAFLQIIACQGFPGQNRIITRGDYIMNIKVLKKCIIAAACFVVTMAAGCGVEQTLIIDGAGNVNQESHVYLTDSEDAYLGSSLTSSDFALVGTKDINGVPYKDYKNVTVTTVAETEGMGMGANYFYYCSKSKDSSQNMALGNQAAANAGEPNVYVVDTITVTLPFEINCTNGVVKEDKRTVVFDENQLKGVDTFYAATDNTVLNGTTININAVNKKYYKKKPVINIIADGIIASIKNNAKNVKESFKAAEGKNQVEVSLVNGLTKKVTFYVDTKAPQCNVKKSEYKKNFKLTFKDENKIKSAKLNGKKVKNGYKIKKAGKYKLVVIDLAGNKLTKKFKIK